MTADDIDLPENTLGYFYAGNGLNNQKIALFGLFLKAWQEGPRRVVLPNLLVFDQLSSNHIPIRLDEAFQSGPLRDFGGAARDRSASPHFPSRRPGCLELLPLWE